MYEQYGNLREKKSYTQKLNKYFGTLDEKNGREWEIIAQDIRLTEFEESTEGLVWYRTDTSKI